MAPANQIDDQFLNSWAQTLAIRGKTPKLEIKRYIARPLNEFCLLFLYFL